MHPSLLWLMTTAWPLEDQVFHKMSQAERDSWNDFYHKLDNKTGTYYPFAQTCWY